MENFLSLDDIRKIKWTNSIEKSFFHFQELQSLVFTKYNSEINKQDEPKISLNCFIEQNNNCYIWGEHGISLQKNDIWSNIVLSLESFLNKNDYLINCKYGNYSFDRFKYEIVFVDLSSYFFQENKYVFNRDELQANINQFLGKDILSKIEANNLQQNLKDKSLVIEKSKTKV